jgi:DNA-binding transcriptional LysR family regulator
MTLAPEAKMDLRRVATFAEVVERGSFTAAARALSLPVSSVSRAVARLEEELGTRLLQRTTRKLALTDAGRIFHDRASHALLALEEAREAARDSVTSVRGNIRVTAPGDSGPLLAPLFAGFCSAHPEVRVELILTGRRVDLVQEGVDLGLRAAARMRDSSLIARKLAVTPLQLFAAPDYLARRGTPRRVSDLAGHDAVILGPGPRLRLRLQGPRGVQSVEMNGPIVVNELSFAVEAAIAGMGITLAPSVTASPSVHAGKLQRVLPGHEIPGAAMWLVYPAGRHLPQRVALLRDHLVSGVPRALAVSIA